jgi:hypothetical protein
LDGHTPGHSGISNRPKDVVHDFGARIELFTCHSQTRWPQTHQRHCQLRHALQRSGYRVQFAGGCNALHDSTSKPLKVTGLIEE